MRRETELLSRPTWRATSFTPIGSDDLDTQRRISVRCLTACTVRALFSGDGFLFKASTFPRIFY
jgi:hypothetical protein